MRPTGLQEGRQRCFQRARRELSDWTPICRAITMQKPHSPLSRHDLRLCAWARIALRKGVQGRGEGGQIKRKSGIKVEMSDKGKITREVQQNRISRIKIERYLEVWSYFGSFLGVLLLFWTLTGHLRGFQGFIIPHVTNNYLLRTILRNSTFKRSIYSLDNSLPYY